MWTNRPVGREARWGAFGDCRVGVLEAWSCTGDWVLVGRLRSACNAACDAAGQSPGHDLTPRMCGCADDFFFGVAGVGLGRSF